jgi:hypothetical protein
MRRLSVFSALSLAVTGVAIACSSSNNGSGFGNPDGGGGNASSSSGTGASSGGGSSGSSSGTIIIGDTDGGGGQQGTDGGEIVTNTIYAHTDTELYSMDPTTNVVTDIGPFAGVRDAAPDYEDQAVTDLAVNAENEIYVNTEAYLYKATLPSSGTGAVQLTEVAELQGAGTGSSATKFVALGFTPADLFGSGTGEMLVGGDENGNLYSIDPSSGATKNLGNFGVDPNNSSNVLALSGDIVFYTSSGATTGIATVRSCATETGGSSGSTYTYQTCTKNNDYLVGIDITKLTGAYTSGTPATTGTGLNGGFYGGSSTTTGPGVGFGEVFGLGAWNGNVYGFTNHQNASDAGPAAQPSFISINTSTGVGALVNNDTYTFTNGWAGAGVTTKVTVTIVPPPPPPTPQ